LTKILLGATLVQLKDVGRLVWNLGKNVGQAVGVVLAHPEIFGAGIIIYFSVVGFLFSYLITRIYLASAFWMADRGPSSVLRSLTSDQVHGFETSKQSLQQAALPDKPLQVSDAAKNAATKIDRYSFEDLKTKENLVNWAQAKLIKGEFTDALRAYEKAIDLAPNDVDLRLNYANLLSMAGRSKEDVITELIGALRNVTSQTDRKTVGIIYAFLTYYSLYLPSPRGFEQAIRYGEEYVSDPHNQESASVCLNIACGYGQQYAWWQNPSRLENPNSQQIRDRSRSEALTALERAVEADPDVRPRIRQLMEGTPDGDNDLNPFLNDKDFRTMAGMP
jgi:tetratricopeptide (TPR) repeat protein